MSQRIRLTFAIAVTAAATPALANNLGDCAVIYDAALAAKQSDAPIRVVQIPAGKLLCWRVKDFVKFAVPMRLDRQVVIFEKDEQGRPILAGLPSPEARAVKTRLGLFARMDAPPVVSVLFSQESPESPAFSYEATEQDTSLRSLFERWVSVEGKRLVWRLPADGKIVDRLQFNRAAELRSAVWIGMGVKGINEVIAKSTMVDGLRTPIQACSFGPKVEVRMASVPCGKQWEGDGGPEPEPERWISTFKR
jgi:hypothetical protein